MEKEEDRLRGLRTILERSGFNIVDVEKAMKDIYEKHGKKFESDVYKIYEDIISVDKKKPIGVDKSFSIKNDMYPLSNIHVIDRSDRPELPGFVVLKGILLFINSIA